MTTPDVADAKASYGMPDGGFADYVESPTDPTTDWGSGNSPGASATGGNGANQMIVDCAAMTHTAARAWVRFVADATTPTVSTHDAMWGSASGVKPTVTHVGTGHYRVTWPATIADALGVSRNVNLRWADVKLEGATPYWPPQYDLHDVNVIDVYTFDTSHVAADIAGTTIRVLAG